MIPAPTGDLVCRFRDGRARYSLHRAGRWFCLVTPKECIRVAHLEARQLVFQYVLQPALRKLVPPAFDGAFGISMKLRRW